MAFDPNDRQNEFRNPEVTNTTQINRSRGSSWMGWVAVLAVILVGAFVWSQMGGSSTDPQTTSSTNPPVTNNAPAAPTTPAPAPATPPAGGASGTGGTGTNP
jgi:magnesium-transporting ATPase (P-type)